MFRFIGRIGITAVLASLAASAAHAQSFVWAKKMDGDRGSDQAYGVAIDGSGNVYTTGSFQFRADFDPGPGTYRLTACCRGFNDIFISKLDSAGSFVWARRIGGPNFDEGFGIAVDRYSNVYTTGYFHGIADFDPGPDTYTLSATNGAIFVSKLDNAGNFLWAKRMGGGRFERANAVAVDRDGNVYTTGLFHGVADFDPGPQTYNLSATNGAIFVSKLDSAGNFVWARRMGGPLLDEGLGVTVDGNGNVYTTGTFRGTADFDPGPGVFNLTSTGSDDVFVSKLGSTGNFVWARRIGGAAGDVGSDIEVDASGNVYTGGRFWGAADFDPGPNEFSLSATEYDGFISKLNSTGVFVWARRLGGPGSNSVTGISLKSAKIYATGLFTGTIHFDPMAGVPDLVSAGDDDIFISKSDSSGSFVWAKNMGGVQIDRGFDIVTDGNGNVYSTGFFSGTADFNPGPDTYNLTSPSGAAFVLQLAQP